MDQAGRARITDSARIAAVRATALLDTPREEAFERLTQLAATTLRAPYAFVTLVDGERSFWKSSHGIDSDEPAQRQNTVEQSFCQYVVASGEPLIVGDAAAHPVTCDNPSIEAMGVAAWAGFPLIGPTGHALGSFCVVDTVVRDWTTADIDVLRALATAAAGELAMRDAVTRANAATERLTLLAEAGAVLAESPQAAGAMTRLAKLIVPTLGDWVVVSLAEPDGSIRDVAWWHSDPDMANTLDDYIRHRTSLNDPSSTIARARISNEPIMVESDALEVGLTVVHSERAATALRRLAPESAGVFPLVARRQRLGVLAIVRGSGRPPMGPVAREVCAALAQRAALAVDNGRLYEEQVDFAARLRAANDRLRRVAARDRDVSLALQQAILPRLAPVPGVHVAARYETASETELVGGDWYDTIALPDGATLLVVGDVSGHSVVAAGIMGQLHSMLRAFAWDRGEAPAGLLARLDRAVHQLGENWLATVVVVHIAAPNGPTRALRWSTAGHPPPLLIGPDGLSRYLDGQPDPPLGVVTGSPRAEHSAEAAVGSTVVLYSDGLIDTRGTDIEESQQALLRLSREHHEAEPDALVDSLLSGLRREHGEDDTVVLAARLS